MFATHLVRFGSNLLLTRLLLPEAFGVMALATVLMLGISMVADVGLQQVIIRSPNADDPGFADTVWTLQVLQGALVAAVLVSGSVLLWAAQAWDLLPAQSTFASSQLPWVVGGLALASFVGGFRSTKIHFAAKRLQLARVTLIELGAQIAGLLAMLAWTMVERSVAALVAGALAAALFRVTAGQLLIPGRMNSFALRRDAAAEIFRFGKWIFLTSGAAFLLSSLDKILLGWLFPPEIVGKYAIASLLIMAFHEVIQALAARVALPAMSASYLRDTGNLKSSYYRARLPVDVLCLVGAGVLTLTGEHIVRILYDDRYLEAGRYLEILALSLIGVRFAILTQIYSVIGNTRLLLYEQVVRLVVLVAGVSLGYHTNGITGVVWGVTASYIAGPLVNVLVLQPRLQLMDVRRELVALPLLVAGLAVGLVLDVLL